MNKDEKKKEPSSNGEVFATLFALDVNGHKEERKSGNTSLSYLSWCWAWAETMRRYPDATYEIVTDGNGLPFFCDPNTGYMVFTKVTINGMTRMMWLPVMDGANKAMKSEPYTYKVKDYRTGGYMDKRVEAATMFDINKAIMRCLVKNLAMFGLGLYIYAGEDLPEPTDDGTDPAPDKQPAQTKPPAQPKQQPQKKQSIPAQRVATPSIVSENLAQQKARQAWAEYRKRTSALSPEIQTEGFRQIVKKVCNKTETAKVTADEWNAIMRLIGTITPQTGIEDI